MATLEAEAHTAAAAAATVATAATTTEATNPTISSATTTTEPNAAATAATAAPAGGRRRSPRATTTAGSHRQQPRALKNPQSQQRKLVLAKSAAHEVQAKARAVLESGWRWGGRSAIGQRAPQSPQEEPRTSHLQTHQRPEREREQQQQHLGPLNTGLERAAPAEAETKAGEAGAQPPRRQPHPQRQGAKEQVQQQQQLPLPGRPGWQSPRSLGPWASRARWLLGLGPKAGAWHAGDGSFMMMALLVIVAVVISGNAVLGAQRDSYKAKDGGGGLSGSANAIPNAVGAGSGSAASSGPGPGSVAPAASHGNANGVSNGKTHSSNADGATGADTNASSTATTTTTSSTSATSTAAGTSSTSGGGAIGSGSLLKAGGGGAGGGVGVGVNRNAIEVLEDPRNGPYFDKAASKNVTALLGKTAYLNCRVKNLGNKTMLLQVSWVRHRDIHLLTVGRYTYTSDQRFRAIHQPQTEDWILQIKYPQHRDSGIYECQVSTTPHMSHYIHLNVVEPSTEIIGAPDLYIESGSTINLTCVILNSPEPPAYIFWNHNNAIINYDSPRGGVSVVTNKGETTTSFLLIKSARPSDSGHYQCNPSNAKPKSVTVHVLNGEFPAAMQRAALAFRPMSPSRCLLACLSTWLCSWALARRWSPPPSAAN